VQTRNLKSANLVFLGVLTMSNYTFSAQQIAALSAAVTASEFGLDRYSYESKGVQQARVFGVLRVPAAVVKSVNFEHLVAFVARFNAFVLQSQTKVDSRNGWGTIVFCGSLKSYENLRERCAPRQFPEHMTYVSCAYREKEASCWVELAERAAAKVAAKQQKQAEEAAVQQELNLQSVAPNLDDATVKRYQRRLVRLLKDAQKDGVPVEVKLGV
jgi:hypothetical protein